MNPDGVSYLNLSDLYRAGQFAYTANGYWSPVYPATLAFANSIFKPSAALESTVAHAVNVALMLGCFASWRFFVTQLLAVAQRAAGLTFGSHFERLVGSFRFLSFAIFMWACVLHIGVAQITPDLLVAMTSFVAAGLLCRLMLEHRARTQTCIAFGVTLGIGYLSKSIMFPVSLGFIGAAWFVTRGSASWRRSVGLIGVAFAAVSVPQIAATSIAASHLTFGETGRLSYGMMVLGYGYDWAETLPPGSGVPVHPVARIHQSPDAFRFAYSRPHSSYPLWDDPAYWMAGMRYSFDASKQMAALRETSLLYARMLWIPIVGIIALSAAARWQPGAQLLPLAIAASVPLLLYLMVHAEGRHVGSWMGLLCAAIITSFAVGKRLIVRPWARLSLIMFGIAILQSPARRVLSNVAGAYATRGTAANGPAVLAASVRKHGVPKDATIGFIGRSVGPYWARLADVRIEMEVPGNNAPVFWRSPAAIQNNVLAAFHREGAYAIVAETPSGCPASSDWIVLDERHCLAVLPHGDTGASAR